jgi:hypothetical protein
MITLRPSYLVNFSVRLPGGVHYYREDLTPPTEVAASVVDAETPEEPMPVMGDTPEDLAVASMVDSLIALERDKRRADAAVQRVSVVEEWKSRKVIDDKEEHARGTVVRGKCRTIISKVCTHSDFGYLCPLDREENLREAIEEAKALADAFNKTSVTCKVRVYVLTGKIADDQVTATKAISAELSELMQQMQSAIAACDPKSVRDAAMAAKKLGSMLDPDAGARVARAVEEARNVANEIARLQRAAEDVAPYLAKVQTQALEEARFAFLDFSEPVEIAPVEEAPRALDLGMDAAPAVEETVEVPVVTASVLDIPDDSSDPDNNSGPIVMAAQPSEVRPLDFV